MTDNLDTVLGDVTLDAPWELTEKFSAFPRWKPADVNAAGDMIVERLKRHGVPATVLEPEIYLSVPFEAAVRAEGKTYRAKPPAYSVSLPNGLEGELVYVPAAYSKSVSTLFAKNQDPALSAPDRLRGKIVISEGFAFPQKMQEFEQKGAIGVIAVNPGVDIHWGICTSIWGTPDLDDLPRKPGIPVAAVNNPDGKALIALAERGGRATIVTKLEEGWYRQKLPVVDIRGSEQPEKFVLLHGHYDSWDVGVGDNATGDATLLEIARVLWKHRAKLKRSVRIAWWPGHSTGRYAGTTWFADEFAIDLDENCVAQINCDSPGCRWATEFKDISWMKETEAFAQSVIREVAGQAGARRAAAPRRRLLLQQYRHFEPDHAVARPCRTSSARKKGYYAVGGCGGNIAWHTENDTLEIADRDILLRDIKVYLGRRAAHRQRRHPAVRLARHRRGIRSRPSTNTRRRRATPSISAPRATRPRSSKAALERFYAAVAG